MSSPKKRGLKNPASPRESKSSSMGMLVTAGLLLIACAVVFGMGLFMGMNGGPATELDSPATDHLLRVSGHSPFGSFAHLKDSFKKETNSPGYVLSGDLERSGEGESVGALLSKATDTSIHDSLMKTLFAHDLSDKPILPATPPVGPVDTLPVKALDTLESRKSSMKREPVVMDNTQIRDRQIEIREKEESEDEKDKRIRLEQKAKRVILETKLYQAAVTAVGEEVVLSAPPTWRLSLGEDENFANTVKTTITNINNNAPGPMESFVKQGGRFPIAVLAANRPDMLKQTLLNLLKVQGARKEDILIFQDGSDGTVASVARSMGFDPIQHAHPPANLRGDKKPDGAVLIAQQYKFALSRAMELKPHAPGVIVVEDDFLFSPDFLEFFHHTAPILERDSSTFILSAWNDNGLKTKVYDRSALCRTLFFPGLGWLLPRRLWEKELANQWPKEHWDHWLRDPKRHKGRESVYPEVNRDYHAGKKGTFMDDYHHNRYFKDIDYDLVSDSDQAFQLKLAAPTYMWAMNHVYEARIVSILNSKRTLHVTELEQLSDMEQYSEAVVWHRTEFKPVLDSSPPPFKPMADYFNIWHEWPRTAHAASIHQFRWGTSHTLVLLVNLRHFKDGHTGESVYAKHLPSSDARVFEPIDFHGIQAPLPLSITKHLKILKASNQGESCSLTCHNFNGYKCEPKAFGVANTCKQMKALFPCEKGCEESLGKEQPAYVFIGAPGESLPGTCLFTSKPAESTCEASHPLTTRICPCIPPN